MSPFQLVLCAALALLAGYTHIALAQTLPPFPDPVIVVSYAAKLDR